MNGLRYLSVVALMLGCAILLRTHDSVEIVPKGVPLSEVPYAIGGRTGRDIAIDQSSLDVLGPGDFLSRIYERQGGMSPISLFIAYFPTQKTGDTIHSPKHCLPGAGWYFESSKYVPLTDANGKVNRVGEYVISDGETRQFVIYWYYAHGRSVANEYLAKLYLIADAIRMNRSDGSLVRVITPIDPAKGIGPARVRAETFAEGLIPLLPRFIPN